MTSAAATPLGVLQGRYRLDAVLGSGGMATVYRARDQLLGREVAVKIFASGPADAATMHAQETEARVLAGLTMHGLVTLFDAGVEFAADGSPRMFLVMELIEGRDLKRLVAAGPRTLMEVAHFGFDLAEALEFVHAHGVIHRDVKPANVLLLDYGADRRPRVKLADFGIAAITDRILPSADGVTTGTAAYLSPEQANGDEVGPATDVYSLGLVLLECLTGRQAFPGEALESALGRLHRDPELPADLPADWQTIFAAMLARDPAHRGSPGDLAIAFRQLIIESGRAPTATAPVRQVPAPDAEAIRAETVASYRILDTAPDATFDRLTGMAARVFQVPTAVLAIVDRERLWFKSAVGTDDREVPRDEVLFATNHVTGRVQVVRDLAADPRTAAHRRVAGLSSVRFFASAPLVDREGRTLGLFFLLDAEPREFGADEIRTLLDFAAIAMHELELRRATRRAVLAED